jgi:hypothetical protein
MILSCFGIHYDWIHIPPLNLGARAGIGISILSLLLADPILPLSFFQKFFTVFASGIIGGVVFDWRNSDRRTPEINLQEFYQDMYDDRQRGTRQRINVNGDLDGNVGARFSGVPNALDD